VPAVQPYDQAPDGFVFSNCEIQESIRRKERRWHARDLQQQLAKAASPAL
jgi:hypothetical protein